MDATSPRIAIADASAAAGLKVGYVRSLLADGDFALMAAPPAKGRPAKASVIDVWRLRCYCILRDAGLSHPHAIWVLDLDVSPRVGALFAPGIAVPVSFLVARLDGAAIHVVPDDGDEYPDVYSTPTGVPVASDAELAITLNLGVILSGVTAALNASPTPINNAGPVAGSEHNP